MRTKNRAYLFTIPAQVVILFFAMAVLTAGAIGIPGIWLLHGQLDRQARELVNQGDQMLQVLLDSRYNELRNLAILTAQRPTLIGLLAQPAQTDLPAYLETLRSGANLDLILVCSSQGQVVAQVGLPVTAAACQTALSKQLYLLPPDPAATGWLLAYQPMLNDRDQLVVIGQAFDQDFFDLLKAQIRMEHLILVGGQLIGGSLPDSREALATIARQSQTAAAGSSPIPSQTYTIAGIQYFAARSDQNTIGLETITLLPGSAIEETRQRLTRLVAVGIVFITLICSTLGVLVTRRVSRPLERLRRSAIALRKGDLTSPIQTNTRVREIAEVTYAMEDARIALQHSMEELRQEKAWGDYLLESVVEGIVTINRAGKITFFSQGAERITRWKQEQVLGKPIDEVFILADRDARFSQRIPLPGGKPQILTILVAERPLTLVVSASRLAPPEAGKANLVVSIRDISTEEAMRGLLGDFLANITHEFRTPLTALAVSIELLLDRLPELSQDEIRELVVSNHLGILSLQNLIDNLLEGASIEAGRFRVSPRPTDVAEVIQEAVTMMLPLMEKNRQRVQVELQKDLPLVQADPRRTGQVLVNLLSNAIKWGPQGSEISLSAGLAGDCVKVAIADQGPGVAPDHKQHLFTRFSHRQVDSGRAEYGAGLGLSVVKAIVETQKGQIGVEERQAGGAVFWFTIPLAETYPAEEDEP